MLCEAEADEVNPPERYACRATLVMIECAGRNFKYLNADEQSRIAMSMNVLRRRLLPQPGGASHRQGTRNLTCTIADIR